MTEYVNQARAPRRSVAASAGDGAGVWLQEHSGWRRLDGEQGWLVLGYTDGNMELISLRTGARRSDFSFRDVPASPVERRVVGAMDTLIVGYESGVLGIWNLRTGRRLVHERLHGPVGHLLLRAGRTFYAATELGGHVVWDLGVLRQDHCSVLRRVWAEVPVVREGGRPVRRPPLRGHDCR